MTNPFTEPTIGAGYRASEPPDDDTEVAANAVSWAKHIEKIATPLKDFIDTGWTNVTSAFATVFLNATSAKTSAYTVVAGDRGKLITVTNATTITLLASATAGSGFVISFRNNDTAANVTIDGNVAETINGATTLVLRPGSGAILTSDGTNWTALITHPVNTGVYEHITSGSASSDATVDFTSLTSEYRTYMLSFSGLVAATDAVDLMARVSVAAAFKSGASDYSAVYHGLDDTGAEVRGNDADDSDMTLVVALLGDQITEEVAGTIWIHDPGNTGTHTQITWQIAFQSATPRFTSITGAGQYQTVGATDGFQLLTSSGNIATMDYTLYGLRA